MNAAVDILVFSYNNSGIIGRCLDSIKSQTFRDFECTLVDDCSTDGTPEYVKRKYPWVKVIEKRENTGPSESRNTGIERTRNALIVMLDSDVRLERNWLSEQVSMIECDNSLAVVGSKLLYAENRGKINSAGGCLTRLGFGFDRGSGLPGNCYKKPERVMYACSAAWIMRRSAVDAIGQFDSTFFYPHEDTDFCWRANIAGLRVFYNPDAVAYHHVGGTTKKMSSRVAFHTTKNRMRSLLKNYEAGNIVKYLPIHIFLVVLNMLATGKKTAKIKGVLWNVKNINDTIKERRHVKKTRKLTDRELKGLFACRLI